MKATSRFTFGASITSAMCPLTVWARPAAPSRRSFFQAGGCAGSRPSRIRGRLGAPGHAGRSNEGPVAPESDCNVRQSLIQTLKEFAYDLRR